MHLLCVTASDKQIPPQVALSLAMTVFFDKAEFF